MSFALSSGQAGDRASLVGKTLHPYGTNHDRNDRRRGNLDPEGIRVAVRYRHLFEILNLHLTKRIKNK